MTAITKDFIVPSCFAAFACKAGDCRHTCCTGLSIKISQEEYFRLAGLACSDRLRAALDVSLHVLSHPDIYRYAEITPDFFGRCRMLEENGLCLLQSECGYDALDAACKYFPRSVRLKSIPECAVSNACERTLELLLEESCRDMPWRCATRTLTFDLAGPDPGDADPLSRKKSALHQYLAGAMAEEDLPLSDKTALIARMADTLCPRDGTKAPYSEEALHLYLQDLRKAYPGPGSCTVLPPSREDALLALLVKKAGEDHPDLALPAQHAARYLLSLQKAGGHFDAKQKTDVSTALAQHFPDIRMERFLSRVMANCMYYNYFPFASERTAGAEGTVLYLAVSLLLLFLAGNTELLRTVEDLIDLLASFFRMVDLTDFGGTVFSLLQQTHD